MLRSDIIKSCDSVLTHDKVIRIYNSMRVLPRGYRLKSDDAWCASWVTAVFALNDYYDIAECSCNEMVKKAINRGIWIEQDNYKPMIADVILYDWQDNGKGDNNGTPDHVGIVIAVDGNKLTIREGNKGGAVGYRIINVNDRYIRGYITPPYENEKPLPKLKTVDDVVNAIINGQFGNGERRKDKLYNYFQKLVNNKLKR